MGVKPIDPLVVADAFFPRDRWFSPQPLTSGHIHATYRMERRSGQVYLLQRINQRVFPDLEAMAYNLGQMHRFLPESADGLRFPRLFPDVAGQLLHMASDGTVWRMQEYISDTYTPKVCLDADMALAAGRSVGLFLRKLDQVLPNPLRETIPGFHDVFGRWQKLREVATRADQQRLARSKNLWRALEKDWEYLRPLLPKGQHGLPLRPVHNDPKLGNMLFSRKTGKLVAIIDWDTIMPGIVLTDYGDLVRSICATAPEDEPEWSRIRFRQDYLSALSQGFQESTRDILSPKERDLLPVGPAWIIFEQSVRFLTDFLAADVYYPVRYAHHNIVRAENQQVLLHAYLDRHPIG